MEAKCYLCLSSLQRERIKAVLWRNIAGLENLTAGELMDASACVCGFNARQVDELKMAQIFGFLNFLGITWIGNNPTVIGSFSNYPVIAPFIKFAGITAVTSFIFQNQPPSIEEVFFPDLQQTNTANVRVRLNTGLKRLIAPKLVTWGNATNNWDGNGALVEIVLSSWILTNGRNYNFSNNKFPLSVVEHILRRAVLSSAYVSGTINLSGGTTAAPVGQSLADKATLQARGVTVLTN